MKTPALIFGFTLLAAGCTKSSSSPPIGGNGDQPDGSDGSGGSGGGGGAAGAGGGDAGDMGGPVGPGGLGYPFASHLQPYVKGTLLPTGAQADLDSAAASFYDAWKAKFIVPGCSAGTYYIDFHLGDTGTTYSVSEGHGYGMVIAAIMAGHDPDAQKYFDGLYTFYTQHYSTNEANSHLMGWAQDVKCAAVQGNDSATDGDLDVAYGLLLADRQWGSGGKINYLAAAKLIIADILTYETNPTTHLSRLGDWATSNQATFYYGTRPSDFMLDHFRAYAKASGDATWTTVLDSTYLLISTMQTNFSPTPGLLPDFVINTNTTPAPAPSKYLEDVTDGQYGYNSCRVPWHLGTEFILSGDPRAQAAVQKIDKWIESVSGGDPAKTTDNYKLDGTASGMGPDMAFSAPFAVGAMAGTSQAWLDAQWKYIVGRPLESRYFEDTLKVLALITLSGNFWAP